MPWFESRRAHLPSRMVEPNRAGRRGVGSEACPQRVPKRAGGCPKGDAGGEVNSAAGERAPIDVLGRRALTTRQLRAMRRCCQYPTSSATAALRTGPPVSRAGVRSALAYGSEAPGNGAGRPPRIPRRDLRPAGAFPGAPTSAPPRDGGPSTCRPLKLCLASGR